MTKFGRVSDTRIRLIGPSEPIIVAAIPSRGGEKGNPSVPVPGLAGCVGSRAVSAVPMPWDSRFGWSPQQRCGAIKRRVEQSQCIWATKTCC